MLEAFWATYGRYGENERSFNKSFISIEDAQKYHREFIENNDLGASNISTFTIYEKENCIGYLSYNGRFWDMSSKEIENSFPNTVIYKKEQFEESQTLSKIETNVAENIIKKSIENNENINKDGSINWDFVESDLFLEMKEIFEIEFNSKVLYDFLNNYIDTLETKIEPQSGYKST